jgi:hypothetical protein
VSEEMVVNKTWDNWSAFTCEVVDRNLFRCVGHGGLEARNGTYIGDWGVAVYCERRAVEVGCM